MSNDNDLKIQDNDDINPNKAIHTKSRISPYVNTNQKRFTMSDELVPWTTDFADYRPPFYTHPGVVNNKLPDSSLEAMKNDKENKIKFKFNQLDNKMDRTSHIVEEYKLDKNMHNLPLNPLGRTGLTGRGWLWRWGPNHAADPIVTRWSRKNNDYQNDIIKDNDSNLPILEFVAIERQDNGGWAIPGGMVDPGENVSRTLKREFGEETMDSHGIKSDDEKKKVAKLIDDFFKNNGKEIYKGYCDDPRNTDNAWIETVAFNFHDSNGDIVGKWKLKAGDDASKVQWMPINKNMKLYASHHSFIKKVVNLHKAHW